jgi:hypothetical protein
MTGPTPTPPPPSPPHPVDPRRPHRLFVLAWFGFRVPGSEGEGSGHCPPVLPEVAVKTVAAMVRHARELPALWRETGELSR